MLHVPMSLSCASTQNLSLEESQMLIIVLHMTLYAILTRRVVKVLHRLIILLDDANSRFQNKIGIDLDEASILSI